MSIWFKTNRPQTLYCDVCGAKLPQQHFHLFYEDTDTPIICVCVMCATPEGRETLKKAVLEIREAEEAEQ